MEVLAHRAVRIELPEPGRLCARRAEGIEHPAGVEPQQRAGRRRCPKRGSGTRRVPEAIVARIDRLADAERPFIPQGHGQEKGASVAPLPLGNRERGRDNWCCTVEG